MASETHVKEWVANLSNHRAGRILAGHLASVEAQHEIHDPDGAMQEALSNERVLVYALARSIHKRRPYPCGLSQSLPRFLAVLNLSGERTLVYSDSPALIRVLCARSSALHRGELEKALKFFENFPKDRTEDAMKFVILSYSMPWQAGTDSEYWHLSACSVNAPAESDAKLTDRIKHFSSTAARSCEGASVVESRTVGVPLYPTGERTLSIVSSDDIAAFCESYSATCLDKTQDVAESASADAPSSAREAQLRSIIDDLQRRRKDDSNKNKKLQEELDQVKNDLKAEKETVSTTKRELEEKQDAQLDQALLNAKGLVETLEEKVKALRVELKTSEADKKQQAKDLRKMTRSMEVLEAKQATDQRQSAAKDALHNAALSQHVATISRLEGLLAASGEKAAAARVELERSHATALQCADQAHEMAMQKLTLALQSKERICNQLSENNERRNVEVESHKTHQAEQDVRIADLETQVKSLTQKLAARPKPVAVRNASIGTKRNASTATHQCAQTQTDQPLEEAVVAATEAPTEEADAQQHQQQQPAALAVGAKVIDRGPSPVLSYQNALDMLQELVNASGNAYVPQLVPMQHVQMQHVPMQMPFSGYPRPLPFPNFVPTNGYHEANGHASPRYSPNQRRGSR